jgi:hypothetical protein
MARHFPPPWTVEQIPGGYKVKDANGQSLAYVYGRETKADADIAKVLTMDEARRIAANTAKLPSLLGKAMSAIIFRWQWAVERMQALYRSWRRAIYRPWRRPLYRFLVIIPTAAMVLLLDTEVHRTRVMPTTTVRAMILMRASVAMTKVSMTGPRTSPNNCSARNRQRQPLGPMAAPAASQQELQVR